MFSGEKVVVVMPAYNAAETLKKTYNEVMEQGIVDEVIVVDDASNDETTAIAKTLPNTTTHTHEDIRLGPRQQTSDISNNDHFASTSRMCHIDPIHVISKANRCALVATDVGNDDRSAQQEVEGAVDEGRQGCRECPERPPGEAHRSAEETGRSSQKQRQGPDSQDLPGNQSDSKASYRLGLRPGLCSGSKEIRSRTRCLPDA